MVQIDKQYEFDGPAGRASLSDLFDGRRQLIVYHFMFDPSWDEGCAMCSFLADNIGHVAHLRDARDTSLVLVSRAPLTKIERFKARMGWTIPWYSSFGSDFNYDFHVTLDEAVAPLQYNFLDLTPLGPAGGRAWIPRVPPPRPIRRLIEKANDMSMEDAIGVVVGGSSGIGHEIARQTKSLGAERHHRPLAKRAGGGRG